MINITNIKIKCIFIFLLILFSSITHNVDALNRENATELLMGQKLVSLSYKNQSLNTILKAINKQSGIDFAADESIQKVLSNITIEVSSVSVEEALKTILKGSGYTYKIVNSLVTFVKEPLQNSKNKQQSSIRKINGKVIDQTTKKPVIGATILIIGTQDGAISNDQGEFIISVKDGDTIEISHAGMISKTQVIDSDTKTLNIVLENNLLKVEDVMVNGYYTKSKESLTGSAVVIKSSDLERVSSQNIISALQVFDPSFRISDNIDMGSNPNAMPDFRIRGNSGLGSISEGTLKGTSNLPTFILDGFEVNVEKVYDLDMNRVESVTILKDASATAIYGSRAANGVVVIITKAPKVGKLSVSYNFTGTIQAPDLSAYNLLGAEDKLNAEVLAGRYDYTGNKPETEQQLRLDYAKRYRSMKEGVDTYWLSKPLHSAFGHKHSIVVEGGDESLRYAVDMNYQANPGVMRNSSRDRFGAGFQLSYNYKNKLIFKNYLTINKIKSKESDYGSFSDYTRMNPYYKSHDEYGNLMANYGEEQGNVYNPLHQSTIGNKNNSKYFEWTNNFDFDWKLTTNLRFKARIAYTEKYDDSYEFISPLSGTSYQSYGQGSTLGATGNRGYAKSYNQKSFGFDGNVVLSYNKNWGDHSFNAVIGGNIVEKQYLNESYDVTGFANEALDMPSFALGYASVAPLGNEGTTRLAGTFANFSYGYANKYLFDASFRLDGSSIYGADKRSSPFWSVGLAWNIHKEKFLEESAIISQLKLLANLGTSGKASFQPYESRTSFEYYRSKTYGGLVGATLMAVGNKNLKWETTTLKDFRVEIGLLKDKLVLTANYYLKDTKDLLTDITLPYSTGFRSYKENIGSLRNEGYELNIKYFIARNEQLNINVYGALIHNKNKIKKISNALRSYNDNIDNAMNDQDDESKKYAGTKTKIKFLEGQSTSAIYAVQSLGINPANGKELFLDKDGSLNYIWNATQQVVCGDTEPKISGTLGANIDYRGFNLNFNFLYEMGGYVYNQTLSDRVENANIAYNVDARVLEKRWKEPGNVTFFKDIRDKSATNVTSRFVQKNDILRLQSATLSYTFNNEKMKNAGIERLKVGFLMNDVFRISTVKQERGLSYPFARSFNINLQVQF